MANFSTFSRRAMDASETATAPPARAVLEQCGLLPNPPPGAVILDNACGAGVVTACLFEASKSDATVICGDNEQTMVDMTAQRIKENGWSAKAELIDAQNVRYEDGHFTHVLMNFGPQLIKEPMVAFKETYRVLAKGGRTGFTCWVESGWVPSILEVFPSFTSPPQLGAPWKDKTAIQSNLTSLGFTDIKIETLDFKTEEKSVDNFLELIKLLLGKLLAGDNATLYDNHMRSKAERGELGMSWQAFVVSAVKPEM